MVNNKYKYLYHGSPTNNLKELSPRPSQVMDNESVVFAGELWVAISSCCNWNDSDIIQGVSKDRPYIKEVYKDAFKKIYAKGGYVYTLPAKTFVHDKRLGYYELISKVAVSPIKVRYIKDPIKLLKRMGIKIISYSDRNVLNW